MSPFVFIRVARLSLFSRVAAKTPACLVRLFELLWGFDFGWSSALRNDLAWFACSGHLPCCSDDIPAVCAYLSHSFKSFQASLKRYALSAFANLCSPLPCPILLLFPSSVQSVTRAFLHISRLPCIGRLSMGSWIPSVCMLTLCFGPLACFTFIIAFGC